MIAVIADDYTGAAEVGGVALGRGADTVIFTEIPETDYPEISVFALNSRSVKSFDAYSLVRNIVNAIPENAMLFKKTDSILRGNIYDEIKAVIDNTNKKRALVIAGNPSLGRVISKGRYYVKGTPLHMTGFAEDPMYPAVTSDVTGIVGSGVDDVYSCSLSDDLPESGVIIGDVSSYEDMLLWIDRVGEETLLAGSAAFFNAFLEKNGFRNSISMPHFNVDLKSSLFVLGSAYPKSAETLSRFSNSGIVFFNIPLDDISDIKKNQKKYSSSILRRLKKKECIAVTIHPNDKSIKHYDRNNVLSIGNIIEQVIDNAKINYLFIEGGSTSFKVMKALNIKKLVPVNELDAGIIQMKSTDFPGLNIITKPGSYIWPVEVLP